MSEIFRHLRPLTFDKDRLALAPRRNGGVSYMLRLKEDSTYDFWLYVCPLDAEFSSKAAVHKLRQVADSGVAPWANVTMNGAKLIDLLVAATVQTDLPTEVGKLAEYIWRLNNSAEMRIKTFRTNAREIYEAC